LDLLVEPVECFYSISVNNGAFRLFVGGVVFLSVCYVAIQRILQLVSLLFRSTAFKELEIVVLRAARRRA
jgi:hypothetical protein